MIWSDLYQDILPHVPGCPEPLLDDAIRRAAVQFCRESHIWIEQISNVYVFKNVTRYSLDIPEGSEVIALSNIETESGNGEIQWPSVNVYGLMTFKSMTTNATLSVWVVLMPSQDATGLPDRIGLHYREALIEGALAILQAIPGRDWSAPNFVQMHKMAFQQGIVDAKQRRHRGNTERPMRVSPRFLL